jgi:hypothetical protein
LLPTGISDLNEETAEKGKSVITRFPAYPPAFLGALPAAMRTQSSLLHHVLNPHKNIVADSLPNIPSRRSSITDVPDASSSRPSIHRNPPATVSDSSLSELALRSF